MALLDLLRADGLEPKKEASTGGGEFACPCPFCRAGEDRFRVWPDKGRWWCRICDLQGDDIQYMRERDGLTYREACEALGREPAERGAAPTIVHRPPVDDKPPREEWQTRAFSFIAYAEAQLWETQAGEKALEYLRGRGLTDETIQRRGLGFNPKAVKVPASYWGLEDGSDPVYCPRGIIIPAIADGQVWYIKARVPVPGDRLDKAIGEGWSKYKYMQIRGSRPAIFGCDELRGRPMVLMPEGEFDAMLLDQEASDLAGVGTLGSASNRLAGRWLWALRDCRRIIGIYDRDEAGENGARALKAMSQRVRLERPEGKDVTEMHQAGVDLRGWVQDLINRHAG